MYEAGSATKLTASAWCGITTSFLSVSRNQVNCPLAPSGTSLAAPVPWACAPGMLAKIAIAPAARHTASVAGMKVLFMMWTPC
jgi:hypothetical protein